MQLPGAGSGRRAGGADACALCIRRCRDLSCSGQVTPATFSLSGAAAFAFHFLMQRMQRIRWSSFGRAPILQLQRPKTPLL
jgi:hypothetical protein